MIDKEIQETARHAKEYGESEGGTVELCPECRLIRKFEVDLATYGPSISAGMFCNCKKKEK